MKALTILSVLTLASFPAITNASFLSKLDGPYKLSGKNCKIDNALLSGFARITSNSSSMTLNLEIILGSFETTMPLEFNFGKGSEKNISFEESFLPKSKRKSWVTDEVSRLTTYREYEGTSKKLIGTYSLKQFDDTTLGIRLAPKGETVADCILTRD